MVNKKIVLLVIDGVDGLWIPPSFIVWPYHLIHITSLAQQGGRFLFLYLFLSLPPCLQSSHKRGELT